MLRADERLDQLSLRHRRRAELAQAQADAYREEAYTTRSRVNRYFAQALLLKERAYALEARADDDQDPVWMKIYRLKQRAFELEQKANTLNTKVYAQKKRFYILSEKASKAFAEFTKYRAQAYATKVAIHAPGECGPKKSRNRR